MRTNFYRLVKDSGKTLKQISQETGISTNTLSVYSRGIRRPRKTNAAILANYFGVSQDYLCDVSEQVAGLAIPEQKQELLTVSLPSGFYDSLVAGYRVRLQEVIEKALEDQEHYKPFLRMKGLCQWLDTSTTTIIKWQKSGMPHIVVDGVTLYDKRKVAQWLNEHSQSFDLSKS